MTISRIVTAALSFCLLIGSVRAEVFPGRWEKMDQQVPGLRIVVAMMGGEKIAGTFKGSSAESITIVQNDGTERVLRKTDVSRIATQARESGSLGKGALIGLGVGAAFGAVSGALLFRDEGAVAVAAGAVYAAMFGGIGAGLGVGVAAAARGHEILYRAKPAGSRTTP